MLANIHNSHHKMLNCNIIITFLAYRESIVITISNVLLHNGVSLLRIPFYIFFATVKSFIYPSVTVRHLNMCKNLSFLTYKHDFKSLHFMYKCFFDKKKYIFFVTDQWILQNMCCKMQNMCPYIFIGYVKESVTAIGLQLPLTVIHNLNYITCWILLFRCNFYKWFSPCRQKGVGKSWY